MHQECGVSLTRSAGWNISVTRDSGPVTAGDVTIATLSLGGLGDVLNSRLGATQFTIRSSAVTSLASAVTSLASTVTSLTSAVTSLTSTVTSLASVVTFLTSAVTSLAKT